MILDDRRMIRSTRSSSRQSPLLNPLVADSGEATSVYVRPVEAPVSSSTTDADKRDFRLEGDVP